jgi:hypothetical protein
MTRDEYEQSKARIQTQHRAAVELMDAAFKAQLGALDLVWMIQGGQGGAGVAASLGAAAPAAPPSAIPEAPAPPRRKSSPQVENDIVAAYWKLPETFTLHEVRQVLGYKPQRGALYRALRELEKRGHIRVEQPGSGHRASVYRRTPKKPSEQA